MKKIDSDDKIGLGLGLGLVFGSLPNFKNKDKK